MSRSRKDDEGGGFGAFWRQFILRKKSKSQKSERSLTSEEKNKLAAEVASKTLGLNKKAQEQVAKAIAAEMQRRHEERERRRRELMISTQAQLPWGPKATPAEAAPSSQEALPKPSAGAAVFPIKMELKAMPKLKSKTLQATAEPDTWDDSMWRPVAAVSGPSVSEIDMQRKKFAAKFAATKKSSAPVSATVAKKQPSTTVTAQASISESESSSSPSSATFGSQPTTIQMDNEAVKEVHAHTLGKILQNILVEASQQQKAKVAAKKPQDMTPDELIELRRRDPNSWDQHTRQNTVISFGLTTPTDDDVQHGKKVKAKKKKAKIHFDEEIEVAEAPIGRDFQFNEKVTKSTDVLKK